MDVEEFRNDLLKRREVKMAVNAESNPGFDEVRKIIAEKFKVETENIVVNNVESKFGSDNFLVKAFIYDSLEQRKEILHNKDVKIMKAQKKEDKKK